MRDRELERELVEAIATEFRGMAYPIGAVDETEALIKAFARTWLQDRLSTGVLDKMPAFEILLDVTSGQVLVATPDEARRAKQRRRTT